MVNLCSWLKFPQLKLSITISLFSVFSFPGATETSLLDKLNKNQSGHKYYEQSLIEQAFVIKHYAGSVKYNIQVSLIIKYLYSA